MDGIKTNVTQDAAVRLMLKFPFWSELYYTMTIFENPQTPTLCVDGRNMWVNPEFWKTLTLSLKISALAHEIGHKMLLHCTRRGHRDPYLWNIAADFVVNGILAKNGFELGKDWLYREEFEGMATEEVYHILEGRATAQPQGGKGEKQGGKRKGQGSSESGESGDSDDDGEAGGDDGQDGSGAGGSSEGDGQGDGSDDGQGQSQGSGGNPSNYEVPGVPKEWADKYQDIVEPKGSKENIDKIEKETIEQVQKAIMTAKAHGSAPVGMDAFEGVCEPSREPWYNHLHRFMQSLSMSEYNWARINRRHLVQHQMFTPDNYSESLDHVVFAIDCSGSVFNAASQAGFAGHVNAILAEAKPKHTHVLYFDAKITRHEELDYGQLDFTTRPAGGGGTDFRPIFDKVNELGMVPEALIILTDCYGSFPDEAPPYPVLWASIIAPEHLGGYHPAFGDVIHVSEN